MNTQLPVPVSPDYFNVKNATTSISATTDDIKNPVNILQQEKSKITTNPLITGTSVKTPAPAPVPSSIVSHQKSNIVTNAFIRDEQKQMEIDSLENEVNDIITKNYNDNITSSISNLSLSEINANISKSCIGILDDIFDKPKSTTWGEYIQIILKKDQRYTYIGFLLIFIAFYILLVTV
jgi:hypothetical protein